MCMVPVTLTLPVVSKGLGAHERRVLAELCEHGALTFRDLCPSDAGPSEKRSVRRVLASLQRKGLVSGEVADDLPGRPTVWHYTGD